MKLNTKIILIILQISLIPWALGGLLAYLSSQEQINTETYNSLDALASAQQARLEDTLQNKLDILGLFTSSPWLVEALREWNMRHTALTKKRIQDLMEAPGRESGIRKLFVATTDGIVIASTDSNLLGANIRAEDYFKLGAQTKDASILKKDAGGIISQYLAGPIISGGTTEGVMVVVTDADDIIGVSADYDGLGKTGETLIARRVGDNALFLTPTRYDPDAALTRVVPAKGVNIPIQHALTGEQSVFANLVDYRGVKVFAATRYIASTGWGIVVKIDQPEAYLPIKRLRELFSPSFLWSAYS
ncbi:MAG: cache domain-containing protein [Minisyncoccia bacterium]